MVGKYQNAIEDPRSMRSIRSTDCSIISQCRRPVQDSFQDHQSQLDVGNVCNLFLLTISCTICFSRRGQKEAIFTKTALAYFCVLKMSNYTAACIIKAVKSAYAQL